MGREPTRVCLEQLEAYAALLPVFHSSFRTLEQKVPRPALTTIYGQTYPRHIQQTAHQAALQKLARYISGLRALLVLVNNRQLQEDGVIKRTLDELGEDIFFLVFPAETPEEVTLKERFLEAFYQEEYKKDAPPTMETMLGRYLPRRRKIREYINRRQESVEQGEKASASVYQGYSGYVHSASPHLMEMVSFPALKFDLNGISDLDLFESHVADIVNYFVRGLFAVAILAGAVGEQAIFHKLKDLGDHFSQKWP